jgi:hypothetical protein
MNRLFGLSYSTEPADLCLLLKLNDQEFRYVHFGNRADFNNVVACLSGNPEIPSAVGLGLLPQEPGT